MDLRSNGRVPAWVRTPLPVEQVFVSATPPGEGVGPWQCAGSAPVSAFPPLCEHISCCAVRRASQWYLRGLFSAPTPSNCQRKENSPKSVDSLRKEMLILQALQLQGASTLEALPLRLQESSACSLRPLRSENHVPGILTVSNGGWSELGQGSPASSLRKAELNPPQQNMNA